MSEALKKDIENTWGLHSQQAMEYRSLMNRVEAGSPTAAQTIQPSHIAKLTATYFLTRGVLIVGAWLIFLILFFGIIAGALWYASSEVEPPHQIIRIR